MPIDERRQTAIEAAVAAYDSAADGPLQPHAAELLAVMFPDRDVCQRSLEDLVGEGFSRTNLPKTLRQLVKAGFLSREQGTGPVPDTYHLHLPPLVRR